MRAELSKMDTEGSIFFFPVSSHSSERQPFLIIVNKKLSL